MKRDTIYPILREIKGITDEKEAVRIVTDYGQVLDSGERRELTDDYDDWEVRSQRIGIGGVIEITVAVPDED